MTISSFDFVSYIFFNISFPHGNNTLERWEKKCQRIIIPTLIQTPALNSHRAAIQAQIQTTVPSSLRTVIPTRIPTRIQTRIPVQSSLRTEIQAMTLSDHRAAIQVRVQTTVLSSLKTGTPALATLRALPKSRTRTNPPETATKSFDSRGNIPGCFFFCMVRHHRREQLINSRVLTY